MPIENEPIKELEQARSYFIAMGCNHFHLCRENFQRRDEYYALNISSDIEAEWRQREVEQRLTGFPFNEPEKIALSYSRLKDMIKCNKYYLECMLRLANDFSDILPPNQIQIVLNVIIGNNGSLTRGGLIEDASKIGLSDLAQRFIICAKTFFRKAEDNNISILWLRGYLVDVIKSLRLKGADADIDLLREKDNNENFKYYQQGAKTVNGFSMRMLAKCYKEGKGCQVDNMQAIYWLGRAANSGNDLAKRELAELNKP